jgi:ligand-binding sensor domain-containing protein
MKWAVIRKQFANFGFVKFYPLCKPVFVTLFYFLYACAAQAQVITRPVQAPQAKQYVFTHLNSFNGLASNIVSNVIQDKRGFVWLATYDGLQRYDGNKFLTFRNEQGNPKSIPNNVVNIIFEDKQGQLWLLANNKVGIFSNSDFTFTEIPLEGNSQQDPLLISFIEQDENGNATIYVHHKGIFTYDAAGKIFRLTDPFKLPADDSFIDYHYKDGSGQYWFAGYSGLSMYDSKTKHLNYGGHNPDNNEVIRHLGDEKKLVNVFGRRGDVFWYVTWVVGDPGAPHTIAYNLKTGEKNKYSIGMQFGLNYFEVGHSLQQKNGSMWVSGKGFLTEFTGGKQPFQLIRNEHGDQSIKFDQVYDLYEDRESNIWVSTDNGVFLFNPDAQLFHSYKLIRPDGSGLIDGAAQAALQMDNGNVLVGSWGGGLYYYDSAFNLASLPRGLQRIGTPFAVWCMITHSKTKKVWIGLQDGGLIVYDPAKDAAELFYPAIMEKKTVRQVTEDRNGNLWFGLQGGHIIKWNMKAAGNDPHKGYTIIKPRDGHYIFKLITDSRGFIWAGTIAAGLYKYDPETNAQVAHYTVTGSEGERLLQHDASDVLQYNDSLLLIASGGINILNMHTGKMSYITSSDGLPANTVMCMQKDKKGDLWVGMMHGLCRVNLEKKIFTRYDRRDGLFYDNFPQAGAYRMNDGRLIFLTDHDFFTFNTDRIMQAPEPSKPVITEFRVANRLVHIDSLGVGDKMVMDHDANTVQIEFSGLRFLRQNKELYFYRLDKIDKDWIPAGDRLQAIYSYLPPGEYVFRAKSENANGVSSPELSFQIIVRPPFWRTWWFYALIVLIAAAILYWIDRERVNRIVALQKVRTQIADNLHQEINTTLNNINLLSEMAKIKADKDIDRSKEYIDQISEKSNTMIIAMDDMLWSINPANDNMEKTILRMKEFVEALKSRHGTGMQMVVDNDVRSINLDMATRHELFLVFKEILRDMVLRTPKGQFLINIDLVKSRLYLKIHDAAPAAGATINSLGMTAMKKRVAAIGAELDVQPSKEGVAVVLLMPVRLQK